MPTNQHAIHVQLGMCVRVRKYTVRTHRPITPDNDLIIFIVVAVYQIIPQ